MSDELIVSGGGVITIPTASLSAMIDTAALLGVDLHRSESRAAALAAEIDWEAGEARRMIVAAAGTLGDVAVRTRQLSTALAEAIENYSETEQTARRNAEARASALVGQSAWLPGGGAFITSLLLGAVLVALTRAGDRGTGPATVGRLVNSEEVTDLVRTVVATSDDLLLGPASGLVAAMSGESVDGEIAAMFLAIGVAGTSLRETPVTVARRSVESVVAPGSLGQLVARIPDASGTGQIRIERFRDATGQMRSIVYLGGTTDESGQPWDMTSNIGLMAGADAGSARAAADAMRTEGIAPDEPVTFVGYSQGGAIASRLIESGEWSAAGLVTVGSPGADIPIPTNVPVIAFEHTEDLIPALAGPSDVHADEPKAVTVQRTLFDEIDPPADALLTAHDFAAYTETARLADATEDARVVAAREEILVPLGATGAAQAAIYRAERVIADDPPKVVRRLR